MQNEPQNLSMPILFESENDERVIEALVTSKASIVGESIANELKSVDITKADQDRIVENFMANKDQLDHLLNLLETDENSVEEDQENSAISDCMDQAPPSNSSSTCTRLAIGELKYRMFDR